MNDNPLKQYFRTAAIHLALPSGGQFYPAGTLDMPETHEVEVYPMTAIDEITYKTPDALFNGSAIVSVIRSCVPSIKDPWQMPTVDLTAVLAAIRIASFTHNMEIETMCPKCDEVSSFDVDLRLLIENAKMSDYAKPISVGELQIFAQPLSYRDLNENNQAQFVDQQLANVINSDDISEEKQLEILSEAFKKISNFTLDTLSKNIKSIQTPETNVTEQEYIKDFLRHCEREVYDRIKKSVVAFKDDEALEPLHVTCTECEHKYDQAFTLDMTSFFEQNS